MSTRLSGRWMESRFNGAKIWEIPSQETEQIVLPDFLPSRTPFTLEMLLAECSYVYSLLGLRNPPRPLLVAGPSSTGSSDSDGGLFAVPTTLPPNSRHGKLFSPNKETELTFLQHLNSISVSARIAPPACLPTHLVENTLRDRMLFSSQMQSDFFLPKPRKLQNRHLRKPLVVQVRNPGQVCQDQPPTGQAAHTHWFSPVSWVFMETPCPFLLSYE